MNHRYHTRREKALMRTVSLFRGKDEETLISLIKRAHDAKDNFGYKSTEYKDKAIRAVYSKLINEINTHVSFYQLPEKQKNFLCLFHTKAKEHLEGFEKRKEDKQWDSHDLMRSRMIVGTIKTYLCNQLYILKNGEAWLGKVIKDKKMPREIVALINSFSVGDYEDKRHSFNEYYSFNSYYGI